MKVLIQGKQMRVSDDLKTYVAEKLVRPLARFYDDSAAELRVEFGDTNGPKGGPDKECHLTFHMPNARTIQIEETTADVYASLDAASDRLIRVCHRELERMREPGGRIRYRPKETVVFGSAPGPVEKSPEVAELAIASEDADR